MFKVRRFIELIRLKLNLKTGHFNLNAMSCKRSGFYFLCVTSIVKEDLFIRRKTFNLMQVSSLLKPLKKRYGDNSSTCLPCTKKQACAHKKLG